MRHTSKHTTKSPFNFYCFRYYLLGTAWALFPSTNKQSSKHTGSYTVQPVLQFCLLGSNLILQQLTDLLKTQQIVHCDGLSIGTVQKTIYMHTVCTQKYTQFLVWAKTTNTQRFKKQT